MKFADLPVGSRFKFRGELFLKTDGSLARRAHGTETLFHGEAEVEQVPAISAQEKATESDRKEI